MAYNPETRRSDNSNCKEHRFPSMGLAGGSIRSIGSVLYVECNNCLALKVMWKTDQLINDKWVQLSDEIVIEPNFPSSNG